MRLLDQVASEGSPILIMLPGHGLQSLPGTDTLSARLRETPLRYVLDDTIAVFATQTAFSEAERLNQCLDLVRVPAPLMWIEWCDASRQRAMTELGLCEPSDAGRLGRAGFLVASDASGRRGTMEIVWRNGDGTVDLAPHIAEFDLDDPTFARGAFAWIQVRDQPALTALLGHVRYRLRPEWRDYYQRATRTSEAARRAIFENLRGISGDFPFFMAFCLIIAARGTARFVESYQRP